MNLFKFYGPQAWSSDVNLIFRIVSLCVDYGVDWQVSESEEGKIEIHDRELQRLLHLTTADLRFADIIIKAVLGEDSDDPYLDGTGISSTSLHMPSTLFHLNDLLHCYILTYQAQAHPPYST